MTNPLFFPFIAPIDIKEGDVLTLFLGQLVLIERDGKEIWGNADLPEDLIERNRK